MVSDLPQIDPGERALAVLGVKVVISKTVERITAPQRHAMAGLEKAIAAKAKSLVAGELTCSWPKLPSYDRLLKDLSEAMSDAQVSAMITKLDDDTQLAFMVVAHKAFDLLQAALPRSISRSLSGTRNLPVSEPEFFHFCGLLRVLEDPLEVLELAAAGALLKYQVAAVRQIYPTVSAAVDSAIQLAVIDAKVRDGGFELPTKAEMGLITWLGIPTDISVYQQLYRAADQQGAKPPAPTRTSIEATAKEAMTPAERIQQR